MPTLAELYVQTHVPPGPAFLHHTTEERERDTVTVHRDHSTRAQRADREQREHDKRYGVHVSPKYQPDSVRRAEQAERTAKRKRETDEELRALVNSIRPTAGGTL